MRATQTETRSLGWTGLAVCKRARLLRGRRPPVEITQAMYDGLTGVFGDKLSKEQASARPLSTRILGRRTALLPPFSIPYRVPHGLTPRSQY